MRSGLLSRWRQVSLIGLLLFARAAAGQGSPGTPGKPELKLAFEAQAVVASGLTPEDKVVWFGVEHRVDEQFSIELARRYDLGTAAADGTARLELPRPIAPRSVWVAVDLNSGAFAVGAPDGYRIARPGKPPRLGMGQGSRSDELLDDRAYLFGLAVRPGEGAWAFAGGDGGVRDGDRRSDGHLRFALDGFDPLPGSPPSPAKIQAADLWFVVDPHRMEISVHKGGEPQ